MQENMGLTLKWYTRIRLGIASPKIFLKNTTTLPYWLTSWGMKALKQQGYTYGAPLANSVH